MILKYNTRYKERLFVFVEEFFNFYSKMESLCRLLEHQLYLYLRRHQTLFEVESIQHYLTSNQGASRRFQVSQDEDQTLLFTIETWPTITARRSEEQSQFFAALEVYNYEVTLKVHDMMEYKLVTHILNKLAFVNGPAYMDRITVNGEDHKMAFYLAACFYKLGGDDVGYFATLDEGRDR